MAAVVGFAFLVTVATPVGKRVFLLIITTIPNAMRCMATTAGMVKKAAVGRSKSPPLTVKKTVACSGSSKRAMKKRCYILIRNKLITFCSFLCEYIKRTWKRTRQVTPTAKRNSYRVAKGAYLSRWATPSLYAHHTPWANTIPTLGAYRPSWLANNRPNIFDHTHRKIVRTPRQLCKSCAFPAQGCGRKHATLGKIPTNIATL